MKSEEPKTLGEALPWQMTRVRDEVIPLYLSVGPGGAIAVQLMRADLDEAQRAMAEGDTIAMLRVYKSLEYWRV